LAEAGFGGFGAGASRLAPDRGAKPPLQEAPRMQEWRDAKEAPIAIPFKQ